MDGVRVTSTRNTRIAIVVAVASIILAIAASVFAWRHTARELQDPEPLPNEEITAELLAMVDADQIHREIVLGKVLADGELTPEKWQFHVDESYRLNQVHADRLQEMVVELGGWPTIARVGSLASASACLLAVHHYTDVEFLEWARDEMEPHVADGAVEPRCYAQVFDRVRLARTGQQRFGTQMRSDEIDGVFYFGIAPVEDPQGLLARRDELGLVDYADYIASQRKSYRVPATVGPYPDEPEIPGLVRHAPVAPAAATSLTDEQRRSLSETSDEPAADPAAR
jgi:hypothetical protein